MSNYFFKFKKGKSSLGWFLFFISFIFIVSIGSVIAAPPVTTVQQITTGYIIVDSQQTILAQGQDYQYNFFVTNISNGALKDNTTTSCRFFLANSNGAVIFSQLVPYIDGAAGYWGLTIKGGNFSSAGYYNYGMRCNSSILAGTTSGLWEVTSNGNPTNPNFFWLILIISAGIIVLGFSIKNAPITILGSFGLVYVGLYIILNGINGVKDTVYTWGWGIIILAVAGYVGIKSAYEMVTDTE